MTIKVTSSYDNLGEPNSSTTATNTTSVFGGARRDAVVQFNALIKRLAFSTFDNPGFAINSNFDVKNGNAISYSVSNVLKTLTANTNFDTGTAATITANLWGIAILTHDGTTPTVSWATTSAAMGYASEALAIAALGTLTTLIPGSAFSSLGYVTVQAGASLWTAGTDALTTGTGGTPAATTNYYNDPTLNGTFGGLQIGNFSGTAITT